MRGFFTKLLMLVLCAAIALSLGACSDGDAADGGGRDTAPPKASAREPDGTDGETGAPEDTAPAEPPAMLAGQELAAEADPLGRAVENIHAALAAYAETAETELPVGVLATDGRARVYETVYDPLYGEDVTTVRIELSDAFKAYVWVGWRQETGALAFLHLDIPQGVDREALTAAVYSDSVAQGIEESVAKCREVQPFEQRLTGDGSKDFSITFHRFYEVRSAGGMALMTAGDGSVRLYWLGGDLKLDGDYLYFLDGGEAVIYGLWYDFFDQEREGEDLYIPDTLGGCPVTRVRLSPCDGWVSAAGLFEPSWVSLPTTVREAAVEFDGGQFVIPNARRLSVMFRPYAKERSISGFSMMFTRFLCLNRDMETFATPEDMLPSNQFYIYAYWGSAIARYAELRSRNYRLSYLDTVDGSWEQIEAAIRDRSAVELAVLAGGTPEDVEGLTDEDILAAVSREDLMAQARSRWDDAVGGELTEEAPQELRDALASARKGDTKAFIEFMKQG